MPYKVKLESFEGPLDLLLFLIKKNEVDIYDIPISIITRQFLEYLEIIQLLDLESASDFILMAATLMRIKSQMLLPKPPLEEDNEEILDPRQELVERLLEYKQFKDVALDLRDKESVAIEQYPRGSFKFEKNGFSDEFFASSEVSLFDLVAAFRKIIQTNLAVTVHHVQEITVTLEQRIDFIQQKMAGIKKISFASLFEPDDDKIVWIVTFIAILEMMKRNDIRAIQDSPFGEIVLIRTDA